MDTLNHTRSLSAGYVISQNGLVSDTFRDVFIIINYITLMGLVSFFGIIFNIVNIIVFVKQGLNDTVNITLLGLAVADLASVTAHLWQSVCYNIWMFGFFTTINFRHLQYLTAAWPSAIFGRISSLLTVVISLERCLCVALPLRVKRIVTVKRMVAAVVGCYLAIFAVALPAFYFGGLKAYYFPRYNRTMLGFFYRQDGHTIEQISQGIISVFQMVSFTLIVVFTAILTIKLKGKSKWRQTAQACGDKTQDSISTKDKKVSKMVVSICLIFILLLSPYWVSGVFMSLFPEFNNLGRFQNIFVSVFSVVLTLEATSSTINIFIYYNMSSKYAATFKALFGRKDERVKS